ncbi:CUB and sushi domain-containing protein 3-like [Eriocheir sinensis]|uniref:CUB and sushi domain-containing protein 3-like n=1 Tax=Eriocheir sinensis TaxID=95602 RepID=UPI0021C7112B|nr:CUB and sushi domain-containing protein 3-like [Eriocheir sinensis]
MEVTDARCPPLPPPPHSTIQENSNSLKAGGTVTYSCETGYLLVGEATLSCQLGGSWSASQPSCLFTDCGLPSQPTNGQTILLNKTTTYGSQVTYECGPNFWLSGSEVRSCGSDGKWTGSDPECVLITCGEPEVPAGGFVTGYSFQVGSEVQYFCDEGHRLERGIKASLILERERERESEDDFNGHLEELSESERGLERVERGLERVEREIERDNPVYVRTCAHDGLWSGAVPVCVYTDCGRVQAVPKAAIAYTDDKTHMGGEVTYTCAHGYRLKGNAHRKCTREGVWSGSNPVCEEIRCPAPPEDDPKLASSQPGLASSRLKLISGNDRRLPSLYGRRRGRGKERENESYRVGSVATYECPKGYVVNTTSTTTTTPTTDTTSTTTTTISTAATTAALLTCSSNGTWSGPVPACSYVDCGLPEKIVSGYYRLLSNTTHFGSQVAYECVPNYKVQGRIRRHCLANGTWAGDSPLCEEVRCPNLTTTLTTALSVVVEDSGRVEATADYSCEKGRRIVGNSQRKCGSNGIWSGSQPRCEYVTCDLPQGLDNGRIVRLNQTLEYGSLVEYHCLPEHRLVGGSFRRSCGELGEWLGGEPKCVLGPEDAYNTIGSDSSSSSSVSTTSTASNTGLYIGLFFGLILAIVFIGVLVYFRMKQRREGGGGGGGEWKGGRGGGGGGGDERPPLPPPNDQKTTPTMTYSSLTDPITGNNIYENIEEEEDEEEEEARRRRRRNDYNNYYHNNNNNNNHHYQNTEEIDPSTPSTTTPV